jgi:hypothetical protein
MNQLLLNKSAVCIVVFIAISFGPIDAASANLFTDPNLVGYWQFNADANDSSQYGNDGTLVGDAAASNSVLVLDGDGDYVDIPNDVTLSFDNKISISIWVRWDDISDFQTLVHGTTSGQYGQSYWLSAYNSEFMFWSVGSTVGYFDPDVLEPGEWYHIVATYDGSTAKVYINTVQKTSFSSTGNITNENGVCLGMTGNGYYPFWGSLDDVMIFDRVLQPWEVRQLYNESNKRYGYFSNLLETDVLKGRGCIATGENAVALGYSTTASGDWSTAFQYEATASGDWSIAMGYQAIASKSDAVAIQGDAQATGLYSKAIGIGTKATSVWSSAFGNWATASAGYSMALGAYTINNVSNSLSVGYGSDVGNERVDFRVRSGQVNVYGDLDVSQKVTMATLILPVKTTTGDPANPVEGQIYVNTSDNKVRVYADGAWRDLATW